MQTELHNADTPMDWVDWWKSEAEQIADAGKAAGMSAYMKHRFLFYGIPKPHREALTKPFLYAFKHRSMDEVWQAIEALWNCPGREALYMAMVLLEKHERSLRKSDISRLEWLITTHSWWDSVDALAAHPVGVYFRLFPEERERIIPTWIASENMWLNRTAIIFQLMYKHETDTDILTRSISAHLHSKEFFIQKAIGWALRQYARVNPDWVMDFAESVPLKPLSRREALKHF